MKLPAAEQQNPEWQAAAGEAVIVAVEDRGPLMHAHVGMMLALLGAKPIPEYDSSKTTHWDKRKLKGDQQNCLDLRRHEQAHVDDREHLNVFSLPS
jgi:hypothetical protein